MTTRSPQTDDDLEILANAALLHAFAPVQQLRPVSDAEVIFSRGNVPSGIHILMAGVIDMQFADGSTVRMTTVGTILGLNAIVSGHPLDYTAAACGKAIVGYVSREQFLAVLNGAPALWMQVLKVLARDIGSCYERVKELSERPRGAGPRRADS